MQVEELSMPKRKAEEEFEALKELLSEDQKRRKDQIYRDFQAVYGHLRHGKKIIDLFESMKNTGLNEDGDPRLAICRADAKQCYCQKHAEGSALFSMESNHLSYYTNPRKTYNDLLLPPGTFQWHKQDEKQGMGRWKVLLKNLHIIWEVEEWKPIPPKDPILVKQLTPNLFGVLATWNLTKLERAIIRGRITGA